MLRFYGLLLCNRGTWFAGSSGTNTPTFSPKARRRYRSNKQYPICNRAVRHN